MVSETHTRENVDETETKVCDIDEKTDEIDEKENEDIYKVCDVIL